MLGPHCVSGFIKKEDVISMEKCAQEKYEWFDLELNWYWASLSVFVWVVPFVF